ncbi:TetR family transcriptional regulator [Amylibacter ulvae]|uniref:TetR family transcriptional regulator n=1 Tax=Paramylibacter ulvae TaxID=1651968 RepID=A0ABQ3D0S1_9RHOB|nr:TetR/AcrR family transcriptional regulator [Amylibacter ulvae]GHA51152.1 TetR family transcriptional regulator [Amylibacter ulvae]
MARPKASTGVKTADRILDESLALIARLGYAAVSMRMIADAVGVNASAIYNHFPTKQAILHRLMADHMTGLLDAWQGEITTGMTPAATLAHFARFHIRYNIARPDQVFISYMELRALEPDNFETIETLRREYEQIPRSIIDAGQASGQFEIDDAHVATMAVLASLTGVNTWFKTTGRLSAKDIENTYAAFILRAVGCKLEEL